MRATGLLSTFFGVLLCAASGGFYISHVRDEANKVFYRP
jgi:hypothetical protein